MIYLMPFILFLNEPLPFRYVLRHVSFGVLSLLM